MTRRCFAPSLIRGNQNAKHLIHTRTDDFRPVPGVVRDGAQSFCESRTLRIKHCFGLAGSMANLDLAASSAQYSLPRFLCPFAGLEAEAATSVEIRPGW